METSRIEQPKPTAIEVGLRLGDGLAFEIRVVDQRGRLLRTLQRSPVADYPSGLALVEHFRLRYGADRLPYDPALAEALARRPLAA